MTAALNAHPILLLSEGEDSQAPSPGRWEG